MGGQAFVCCGKDRVELTDVAARWVSAEHAKPKIVFCTGCKVKCSDQQRCGKPAGAWLPFWLPALDWFSKNGVGRTRFELVTFSVSGNLGASVTVGLSRTGSP